ncbi:unnamed protein product [Merluccius merluccius]
MDATQMISDSMLESDEEEEDADARAEPLATLRVFKNKHIPETVLPLYLGENVLGRDPSACSLPLHAQSVSKQHTAISISVFRGGARHDVAAIEALVWDMGSMNGTRKGRLKLAPHVRYALSEGDKLIVADIPCQFTSCGDTGSLVNRDSLVARESQGAREDGEVHENENAEEPARASLGESGAMMETPARTKGLSFEQTPTQPEGSLVPESDSDSDGERGKKGQWRKTLEADSHVSSPTCSTFLSPSNKIIPESEDESPITPSSPSKHRPARCVRVDNDQRDMDAWQQQLKNEKEAQFIVADSEVEEEEERATPVGTEPEKRAGSAPENPVNTVSSWVEDGLDQPGPALSTEPIPLLNMDSDTDVEEEEESSVSAGLLTSSPPAYASTSQLDRFHMDSDTDVDDEDGGDDATPAPAAHDANTTESPGEVLVAQQTDSDTDVDDDDDDVVTKATHALPQSENTPVSSAHSTQPLDIHLGSDTDAEEEEDGDDCDDSVTRISPAKIEAESREVEGASAGPPNFDLGSDTDDEVLPADADSGPTSEAAHTPPAFSADTCAHLEILSDSDTDAEEDSPLIAPIMAVATNAGPMSSTPPSTSGPFSLSAAVLGPDSDADTDVDETSTSRAGDDADPAGSDTDMEDEEEAGGEGTVGRHGSCSSDEKDFGSLQGHKASLQQCSTPVELSGGVVAEMETQEYLIASIDLFKCPMVPAPRLMVSSSFSDSQGEDDFVVAETQSFIVDNRDQQASPSGNYTLDETQPFIPQGTSMHEEDEDGTSRDTSFQLGLSDSIHLQPQAQALVTESTQAFVLSDRDVNLEDTQVYPTTPSVDGSSMELDSDLEATQSYAGSAGSSRRSAGHGIERQVDFALAATQPYIPESHSDEEDEENAEDEEETTDINTAETQLMCFPSGFPLATAETQPMCELQEENNMPTKPLLADKAERVDGEGTPPVEAGTTCGAKTQPIATSEAEESDEEDSIPAPRKRSAMSRRLVEEEDTQVMTGSVPTAAETRPVSSTSSSCSTSSDEGKKEEDNPPSLKRMRSRSQRKLEGATSTRATAAGTEPVAYSATPEQEKGRPRRGRGRGRGRGRELGPGTSRGGRDEEEEEEKQEASEPPASLRTTRSKGKTSSSTRGGTGVRPEEERGEVGLEREEGEEVRQGLRRKTRQPRENAREKKERLERERKEQEREEKEEKEKLEREKKEREERERLEMAEKERIERERKKQEEKERLEKEEQGRLECEKKEREERLEKEEQERLEKERKELVEKDRLERVQREKEEHEKLEHENKEREERERLEKEEKERKRKVLEEKERLERMQKEERERLEHERKEREEREREEQERIDKERRELKEKERLEQIQKEKEEQEKLEHEKKEREEKERLEKEENERKRKELEEKERLEKEEQERLEREKKEREERLEKEEQERLEKEKKELEERERLERIQREQEEEKERIQREKEELEEKERLKKEKMEQERERLRREKAEREQREALEQVQENSRRAQKEEEDQARIEIEKREREEMERQNEREQLMKEAKEAQTLSEAQTPRTTRGRRATRRNTAGPSEQDAVKDDGCASRTRSRSNSSNSVSSERSASSAIAQESKGERGRGRGAKKNHPPAAGTGNATRESMRRRTVAGETPAESWGAKPNTAPGRSTRSRSNSTDSLNSEVSTCSSSQSSSRGTRGAGRGRGRKTLPAPETNSKPSSGSQNEVISAPKATARGRKSKTLEAAAVQEKTDSQQPATTRGRRRTNASGPIVVEEQEDTPEDSALVISSTTGRGRGRKAQIKCEPVVTPVAIDDIDGVENNGSGRAKGTREQESEHKVGKPVPVQRGRGSTFQTRRKPNEPLEEVGKEEEEEEEEEEETIERKVRRGRQSVAKKKKEEVVKEEEETIERKVRKGRQSVAKKEEVVTQTPTGKSSRKRGTSPAEASPVAKSPRTTAASPGTRLRAACQPYKVLFTGLVDEVGEKVVVQLGGSLALGVSDMTHLVTDRVRRTVKFLCAMARGIPVVTTRWLEKSGKAGSFLSPSAFIVKDAEQEKKFNFCLQESIRIASNQPLLQGYEIHITKSVKPEPTHMKDIVSCCGASFLAKMPSSHKDQTVVVSCEEDWPLCGPAVAASLPVVSAEFILTGILQQKADVEAHALPRPAPATTTPPQPAGARGRSRKRT